MKRPSDLGVPYSPGLNLRHEVKGSPVYPAGQEQTGTWFLASQLALAPHELAHASRHLPLWQVWCPLHSELSRHSALVKNKELMGRWKKYLVLF